MYEISQRQTEQLLAKIERFTPRPDLSHMTLEKVGLIDGDDSQVQLTKLDSEFLSSLPTPQDILDHLIEPEHLEYGGALQVAWHFNDSSGERLDQSKRRRMKIKLQKEGTNIKRESAQTRPGADNILDTNAEVLRDERATSRDLLDRLLDNTGGTETRYLSIYETMRAGDLAHHTEVLQLHAEKIRTETTLQIELWKAENAGILNDFRKLPQPTQIFLLETVKGFLTEWSTERKIDKEHARKLQAMELEERKLKLAESRKAIESRDTAPSILDQISEQAQSDHAQPSLAPSTPEGVDE